VATSVAVAVALARARAVAVALAVAVAMAVAFAVVVAVMSPLPTNSPRQRVIRRWKKINGGQVLCAKTFFSGGGEGCTPYRLHQLSNRPPLLLLMIINDGEEKFLDTHKT
jgi:hypothetical protein